MHCFFVVLVILGVISKFYCVICDVVDICNETRSRIYVPVGSSGFISAKTVDSFLTLCRLQVMSCNACVVIMNIWLFDLNQKCSEDRGATVHPSTCRCDRLEITEPLNKVYSRKLFCSDNADSANLTRPHFTYRSLTRGVGIVFVHSREYSHPFTIEYTAKHNIHVIEVDANPLSVHAATGTINSPFFPIQYPTDFRSQFKIQCSVTSPEKCAIRLIFTDHQLADQSVLEFFEENHQRIAIVTGRIFRPPVIISSGPILSINFYANKASGFGFKANYSVVIGPVVDATLMPKTACGGFVESIGGTIIMNKMTDNEDVVYDCIWIMKPAQQHLNLKTHLYLKVTNFLRMGNNTHLEIRKGTTSSHLLLQSISRLGSNWSYNENVEHVTNLNSGFYISFRGTFNADSKLAFSYAAFSFSHSYNLESLTASTSKDHDCYLATDFLCQNYRCVEGRLQCDGFDHCGDNSDEMKCVYGPDNNHKWATNAQNYYFPVMGTYPNLPAGFFVAFCASFITFILCSLFCTVIYRTKYQHDYSRLRAISLMMASAQQRSADQLNTDNGYIEEPPPEYDFPPNYHDVFVYNTMKKVISDSKNVQNSAIQTDINEHVTPGCSSVASNTPSGSRFQKPAATSEGELLHEITLFSAGEFSKNELIPCNSSKSTASSQPQFLEFMNVEKAKLASTSGETIAGNPSKSTNNLSFDTSKPFYLNGKRFSQSMDALYTKSYFAKYSYKKILNPTGNKEVF